MHCTAELLNLGLRHFRYLDILVYEYTSISKYLDIYTYSDIYIHSVRLKQGKSVFFDLLFKGAGATFDWLFFDNSKLINFDC